MNETTPLAAQRPTTRDNVPFDRLDGAASAIAVSLVLVPPRGDGRAWGHTKTGGCVEFTQAREAMLRLFHQLRAAGRISPPPTVEVDGIEWEVRPIERGECPVHSLPEVADGAAVAFAPY
jgi:hypothetical protein